MIIEIKNRDINLKIEIIIAGSIMLIKVEVKVKKSIKNIIIEELYKKKT